jgi:hypothetical protein
MVKITVILIRETGMNCPFCNSMDIEPDKGYVPFIKRMTAFFMSAKIFACRRCGRNFYKYKEDSVKKIRLS